MWLANHQFRTVSVGDHEVPAVILGTSPFIGAGQFGKKAELYHRQFFLQPENIIDIVMRAVEWGVNAVQVIAYHRVLEAFQEAAKRARADLFLLGTVGLGSIERDIEMVLDVGAQGVIVHGSLADRDIPFARQHLANLRGQGLVTGIATHRPELTIPRVEEMEEVALILSAFNKLGTFMHPSVESTLQALESTSKTIMAMKPLAAGSLPPQEGLSYLSGKVAGVAVGIASVEEAKETFAVAKRRFAPSRTAQPVSNTASGGRRLALLWHPAIRPTHDPGKGRILDGFPPTGSLPPHHGSHAPHRADLGPGLAHRPPTTQRPSRCQPAYLAWPGAIALRGKQLISGKLQRLSQRSGRLHRHLVANPTLTRMSTCHRPLWVKPTMDSQRRHKGPTSHYSPTP